MLFFICSAITKARRQASAAQSEWTHCRRAATIGCEREECPCDRRTQTSKRTNCCCGLCCGDVDSTCEWHHIPRACC